MVVLLFAVIFCLDFRHFADVRRVILRDCLRNIFGRRGV